MKQIGSLILLMLLAVCPGLVAQQNPSARPVLIKGNVISDASVSFSTVTVLRVRDSFQLARMVTDSTGKFELKINTGDACMLAVSHVGYFTAYSPAFSADTAKGGILYFSIRLNRKATQLKGVEVRKMAPVIERKLDRVVVRVDNNIVSSGESVMELLRTLPGIVIDGASNVIIKGKSDIRVLIDGRETYQKDEQLKILLASMSANNVQKIEIISNPPAKYAAEGAGGIINIITKTRETPGISGNIYSSYAQGIYGRTTSGGLINYKNKRLLLTGSYDLTHGTGMIDGDETRKFRSFSPEVVFHQVSAHPTTSTNHYYKAGLDWSVSRNQGIAISLDGAISAKNSPYNSMLNVYQDPHSIDSSYSINNLTETQYSNSNLNANYSLRIDSSGQALEANYSHLQFHNDATNNYHSLYFNGNGENPRPPQIDISYNKAAVEVNAYKLDYKRTLPARIQLETGVKYTSSVTDNDITFYNIQNGVFKTDTNRTNHFIYTENIAAAYVSARKDFKKLDVQLGLRYEHTQAKLNLTTSSLVIHRHLNNLFPTLFLEYRISEQHKLNIASGRRIKRPDYAALNPFAFYFDPFSYSMGNPYLLPQYTFNNELTYTYKDENSISLGYSSTKNVINEITLQYDTAKTVVYQYENISSSRNLYLGTYVPWKFASWWNASMDLNVSYTSITGNAAYGVFSNKLTSVTVNYNNTLTFAKLYAAQVNMLYFSPFADGVSVFKSRGRISLGLRRSFFNKSLTVGLRVTDILFTDKERVTTNTLNQDIRLRQVRDTRRVGITLTYNFKSGKKFNERKVQFGGQEERNRMNITPKTN